MNKRELEALMRADEIVAQIPQQLKDECDIKSLFEYLKKFFNTENWNINASPEDWFIISFIVCRIFDININKEYKLEKSGSYFFGAVVEVNNNYCNKVINNIRKISYVSMYPSIIYTYLNKYDIKSDFFDLKECLI